ncbi:DUF411 domain-containing protein [Ferrovibrio sp.]|uniref:DUF411 domain-containing protein n=1 Tax=Ferrovibrio sp. TaxID=1917215 RepID=UPI000CC67BF4|nr:DUF411 domain-containing protein [Ferrovibrio sp.]PJI41826.1 MAG: hypothetical protein CTR53_05020 [Ferrovibrio sp.]
MNRRTFLMLTLSATVLPIVPARAMEAIHVLKTSSCGCCNAWIIHLRKTGFMVTAKDAPMAVLNQEKLNAGLTPELSSCHTARVGGYVIEGHVPAEDIKRLLRERPDALGLTVPGMPEGSPGMETGDTEAYEVLLFSKGGTTSVYSRYS